jgi:DNA-binding LacI/PurR family transcriptional regulator
MSPARPTLEQVARHAGVSRATVSRVVNGATGSGTVAPHLRELVTRAATEMGYVPNRAARALATNQTDTIALVLSEPDSRVFGDPFFAGIVRGVSQELDGTGIQLVLSMAQSTDGLDRVEGFLVSGQVDGVLLISEHGHHRLASSLSRAGVPLVIGGRPLDAGVAVPYVDNDNVGGATLAARHLTALGRSRLGTITGPMDMGAGVDRLVGFEAGLGQAVDPARVEHGDFTEEGGAAAMSRLLDRAPDLDAVFVASDLMALGALSVLRRAGRRVPQDVAVIGFDDISRAAHADPPLTTVRQHADDQGRMMVRLLLARIRPGRAPGEGDALAGVGDSDHVILPVALVLRESA